MEIDLAGSVAALVGGQSPLAAACAAAIERNGGAVAAVGAPDELPAAIARIGRLDVLVIFAGDIELEAIEAACRTARREMSRAGRIVNVASAFGLVPVRGEGAASASAAAVFALTRSLALEFGGDAIRVNAVAVGPASGSANDARFLSHTPLDRSGDAAEIAAAVMFLIDPENSYMTGHVLTVDGGWTAGFARNF